MAPSFDYYFEKDYLQNFSINADFKYNFGISDKLYVFPIAGLSYNHSKIEFSMYGYDYSSSAGEIGLNLGGGAQYGPVFLNIKYNTSFESLVLSIGYSLNLKSKE